jgi:hypothetical protein
MRHRARVSTLAVSPWTHIHARARYAEAGRSLGHRRFGWLVLELSAPPMAMATVGCSVPVPDLRRLCACAGAHAAAVQAASASGHARRAGADR